MENVKKIAEDYVKDVKALIENVKHKKNISNAKEVQTINIGIFALYSVFGLLIPSLFRVIVAGTTSDAACATGFNFFIRLDSIAALQFLVLTLMSKNWSEPVQQDIMKIIAGGFIVKAVLNFITLYYGGSLVLLLLAPLHGGLAFINAKFGGLIAKDAKETTKKSE